MSDEQNERRIYRLDNEHDFRWADLEEFVPEQPKVPDALQPFFPTGETVDEVGELSIYAFDDEAPHFAEGEGSVEATPEELAEWRALWTSVEEAQQVLRRRLEEAQAAYEETARQALADLATAMEPWAAVEATLKERSSELAAKLHVHRTAAEEWKKAREEKEQEHLDTIEGPRVIVLYKPKSLGSRNKADRVARVHLVGCKRRAQSSNAGLRAGEAWNRLKSPYDWIRGTWSGDGEKMQVKFCSFCKPWAVFQEHIEDFPSPRYSNQGTTLGEIRLTDVPEGWTS
ncbi:hypothetical protein [Streptomyces sp. NPDC088727]|uniref:hypothetical protein n=1 Tax=Streptomyces sp. NPDC088727 TaxID=3365875 RepID=UPI00381C4DC6